MATSKKVGDRWWEKKEADNEIVCAQIVRHIAIIVLGAVLVAIGGGPLITLKYGIDAVYVVAHHVVRMIVAQTPPLLPVRYRRAQ